MTVPLVAEDLPNSWMDVTMKPESLSSFRVWPNTHSSRRNRISTRGLHLFKEMHFFILHQLVSVGDAGVDVSECNLGEVIFAGNLFWFYPGGQEVKYLPNHYSVAFYARFSMADVGVYGDAVKQIFHNKTNTIDTVKSQDYLRIILVAAASSSPAVMEIALWNKALLKEGLSFVVLPGDEIRIGQFLQNDNSGHLSGSEGKAGSPLGEGENGRCLYFSLTMEIFTDSLSVASLSVSSYIKRLEDFEDSLGKIFIGREGKLGSSPIEKNKPEKNRTSSFPDFKASGVVFPARYLRILKKGSPDVDTHGLSYSYLKLGYSKALTVEAENLSNLIKGDLGRIIKKEQGDWLIAFLTGRGWNHAATLLGKEIALKHNLRSVVILPNEDPLSKVYLADVDYSSIKTREQRLGKIYNRFVLGKDQAAEGKNVILIEDSLMTGATIEVLTSLLKKNGALNIYPYVLIKFIGWSDAGFEDEINRKSFKEHGIESLVKVFNDPESPRTKRLIRYSLALSGKELYRLTNRLKPEALLYLYLSAIKHFPLKMPDYLNLLIKRWQEGCPLSKQDGLLKITRINASHSVEKKKEILK